jgi:hypothetical protein
VDVEIGNKPHGRLCILDRQRSQETNKAASAHLKENKVDKGTLLVLCLVSILSPSTARLSIAGSFGGLTAESVPAILP